MANPKNELLNWNVNVGWELNHDTGIARMTLTHKDKLLKSMRFVQGLYVDEHNQILHPEYVESLKLLLSFMPKGGHVNMAEPENPNLNDAQIERYGKIFCERHGITLPPEAKMNG